MVGRTLLHYRVLEKIGAGGMGVVYRAHDEKLDRDVALKVLPPGALADEAARKKLAAKLEQMARRQYVCAYEVAEVHVALGDNDTAYKWMQKGVKEQCDCLCGAGLDGTIQGAMLG